MASLGYAVDGADFADGALARASTERAGVEGVRWLCLDIEHDDLSDPAEDGYDLITPRAVHRLPTRPRPGPAPPGHAAAPGRSARRHHPHRHEHARRAAPHRPGRRRTGGPGRRVSQRRAARCEGPGDAAPARAVSVQRRGEGQPQ
ncbi:hypothetical protein [Streptomyces sp. CB02923]|uniref:hypothetical protein n=1 Tax=Streptomyces sp. CB02923 TaxID=1718985 RepID=UPI003082F41C